MPTSPTNSVLAHLRRAVLLLRDGAGLGDGELLGRFIERHDKAALAALIKRHGPMVWGVCRRLLSHHDAEDAFQATFLVLVRKAASIVPRAMVGNWLYGVAHQTALQARRTAARRRAREVQVTVMPDTEAVQQDQWADVQPLLDQELSRLPDIYRAVLVLCDLEDRTRKEVARQLGVPEGTVAGRLARARAMLAKRLTQRGVTLSGGALAAVLAQNVASAGVPTSVVSNTISAASSFAAGHVAATGPVSAKVAALTEGVLKAMMMSKLKAAIAIVLVLGFIVTGATVLSGRTATAEGDKPPVAEERVKAPPRQEPEKEAVTAWGQEVDGLQAGLTLKGAHTYHTGKSVNLEVRLRNVGKAEVKVTHGLLREYPPAVSDAGGERMTVAMPLPKGYKVRITERVLKPGETISLYYPVIEVESTDMLRLLGELRVDTPTMYAAPGTYRVAFGGMVQSHPTLSTGTVEIDVKEPTAAEEEAVTAWGQEVGGLQAGLSISNRSDVQIGGKATAVVKLRNVSNETITASAWPLWMTGPKLVDALGKPVRATSPPAPLFGIVPAKLTLKPGQTVVVANTNIFVVDAEAKDKPFPEGVVDQFTIHVRPGTYRADFRGFLREHPTLATGTMGFEVKVTEKEGFTAWGKEVNGLQAGLGFKPGQKRAYSHGETVSLVVRVRNVSKDDVRFQYARQFFIEKPPSVTDDMGKPVPPLSRVVAFGDYGIHTPEEVSLAAGKGIELYELKLELRSGNSVSLDSVSVDRLWGSGKVRIQYERLARPDIDGILGKLATGKLDLEITSEPPPAAPEKNEPLKQEKEGFTAWGEEVGGLQVGLGLLPGQKRTYYHGETVTLVYRVRNVGKKDVKVEYLKEFLIEKPFNVTDGEGKPIPQEPAVYLDGANRLPVEVTLAPGKEIELYKSKLELKPGNKASPHTLWATGKVNLWYERVFGNSKLDPTLSKLATGKVEVEIKSEPPAETENKAPQKKDREDANLKPIKIRVYIEKVNVDTATITASCMLIGEIDNVTKPLRFENLRVAEKAKITDRGKEVKLTDLQLLPRDTHFYLFLKAYEEEMGFEVVGIETIRK